MRWSSRAVSLICAAGLVAAGVVVATPAQAAGPLKSLAAARGKFIGTALATDSLANEAMYRTVAAREFNQTTPENAMKWDATEPNDNQFNFSGGDQIVAFAQQNGMTVHGHTLVWHSQTPGYVQGMNATNMRAEMQAHIAAVVGHWANNPTVTGWDVVNEIFNEDGTFRQSFWFNTLGQSFVADAFRAARQADPDAKLCINDFNVEDINAKSTAMFNLVQSLRSQGVPIDCVGFQSHLAIQFSFPSTLQQNIQRFANLGVHVRISELDVRMLNPESAAKDTQQAQYYTNVVNACLAVTNCDGITIWGFTDLHSWIPGTFSDQCCGLIFDNNYQPKPAYDAVANAFGPGPVDTTPPSAPANLAASGTTQTGTSLTWTASTDNVGVTGYDILQAPGASGGTFTQIGTSTTTSFAVTGLTAGSTFRFQVRARDAAGNTSAVSNTAMVTTQTGTGDTQAPTAPTGLAASGTTASGTSLAWTASTDNVGVTGYDILQATGATGGTFTQIGTSTTTSFAVTGLTANTTYRFQVRARDAAGNVSAVSNTAQITTQTGSTTGACTATPTVQTQWGTGYVINPLTITNTSTSTINSWTVTFTLPAGHTLSGSWNATVTTSGQTVTAKSVSFNGSIPPGGTVTSFGFQVNRPDGNTQMPASYTCTSP
jgi:endo-1,4-beta-xylanase